MFAATRCHHVEQLSSIYLFAATVVMCQYLSVICRGLRLFLCPLLLSALIEILLCRMFPHPRRKSRLARPESSEISEMLWRTITCIKNAVDVLLAAKWLGSFLSSLNSMAAETLDVVKMLLFHSFSGGRRRSSTTRASWPGTLHLTASINGWDSPT